ncbi:helix-turn-helix domain-containing protein [Selenomonadales bacterium OttesenSCG-928-I06]|nr:helix-turn-helix domain-containing protein [Selenomonadales bacterium OttesenSCG-928-I06]
MTNFSRRLSKLQKEKKLLKKDIAQAIGISIMAYYRYEKGDREPTVSVLISLAKLFDISTDYLLGLTDDPCSHKK